MSNNKIKFIETSVHWSTYHHTTPPTTETPTQHKGYGCWNSITLDAKSFIYLWQTSIDREDFQARIYNLRKGNPRFYDCDWGARASRYRKKGIKLQQLHKETNNEKLKKLAKKCLTNL